jgi:hypothetical protein
VREGEQIFRERERPVADIDVYFDQLETERGLI